VTIVRMGRRKMVGYGCDRRKSTNGMLRDGLGDTRHAMLLEITYKLNVRGCFFVELAGGMRGICFMHEQGSLGTLVPLCWICTKSYLYCFTALVLQSFRDE